MKRAALILVLGAALMLGGGSSAQAAALYYPGGGNPPATQVTRTVNLKDAAKGGLIKLSSKGPGEADTTGFEGDRVQIDLTNKRIRGPITVTIHAEFSTNSSLPPEDVATLAQQVPEFESRTEAELNNRPYKTSKGDPIRFDVDYRFRNASDPPTTGYHQIKVIDPTLDLDQPDPDYRPRIKGLGEPNVLGAETTGTFTSLTFTDPATLAHETLHLAGLDDKYGDFYQVGGRSYPLPQAGMTAAQVAKYARNHQPRLPPNGKVVSKDRPGTNRCDVMGTGVDEACRRLTPDETKFFENQAGVDVVAQPGDLILNKNHEDQSFAVGMETHLFAAPGQKTVAKGLTTYCVNANLGGPAKGDGFDILGPSSQLPGYEDLAKLLALNGQLQTAVDAPVNGMQTAIWNVTNNENIDQSLAFSDSPDQARALLAQAGIAENSHPDGLPYIPTPNAGSGDTASVNQDGSTDPTAKGKPTKRRPTAEIQFAKMFPSPLHGGGNVRGDLFLSVEGSANRLGMIVQHRSGGHWRTAKKLGKRKFDNASNVIALKLGHLSAGSYRLVVSATNKKGKVQSSRRVSFRVR